MHTIKPFLSDDKKRFFVAVALSLFSGIQAVYPMMKPARSCPQFHHQDVEWIPDQTVAGVTFYHAVVTCNNKNVVLLKFDNRSSNRLHISWKETFVTKSNEQKNGFGGTKELTIPPGITAPSGCTDTSIRQVVIRSSDIDPTAVAEISGFMYKDIIVNKP